MEYVCARRVSMVVLLAWFGGDNISEVWDCIKRCTHLSACAPRRTLCYNSLGFHFSCNDPPVKASKECATPTPQHERRSKRRVQTYITLAIRVVNCYNSIYGFRALNE